MEEASLSIDTQPVPAHVTTMVAPRELTVPEIKARLDKIQELMRVVMRPGVDYGKVPGTDKPTLLKPGAEKLCVLFQLGARKPQLDLKIDGDHLTVYAAVTLFHIGSDRDVYSGMAVCSTHESKYAWRRGQRACPMCGVEGAIIKGRAEFGGGWLCWARKGGCGEKFLDTDTRITQQEVDRVPNPDLADQWNTVVKMAVKRAKIDATLGATGASALFTQDIGDEDPGDDDTPGDVPNPPAAAAAPRKPRAAKPAPPPAPPIPEDRVAWLRQQCKETEVQEQLLCNQYKHASLEEFTDADFEAANQIFKARREKMGLH